MWLFIGVKVTAVYRSQSYSVAVYRSQSYSVAVYRSQSYSLAVYSSQTLKHGSITHCADDIIIMTDDLNEDRLQCLQLLIVFGYFHFEIFDLWRVVTMLSSWAIIIERLYLNKTKFPLSTVHGMSQSFKQKFVSQSKIKNVVFSNILCTIISYIDYLVS